MAKGEYDLMDALQSAILKVREKVIPQAPDVELAKDPSYKGLYNILQIFDIPDGDTEEQVSYIYNFLMENGGDPRDQITSIHSKLGSLSNERLVDRVHKFCRLKEQANKYLNRYENLMRDVNAVIRQ